MRLLFLLTLICFIALNSFSQTKQGVDTSLKFNQRYTHCEKKWVVLSKSDTVKSYTFGYIYADSQAGFTFDLKGIFTVDENNAYVVDTTATKNSSIKYRISPNWKPVALVNPKHFNELHIKAEPYWVKNYYTYTDTATHNYRWGWIYNDLDEPAIALTYLEKANKLKPDDPKIVFEMAFAGNALSRFDDVIKLLEPAILLHADNAFFYKELGYAYQHKRNYDKAIETYKKGLEHFADKPTESRGELAFNTANAYKSLGNQQEYKNWMIKAKTYTPIDSRFYSMIIQAGF